MCTAVTLHTGSFYFGRTLDLEYTYDEKVVVTPRKYPFFFREMGECREHYAMIGMATVADGYPLYYEAANECGLAMAGLNFPGNAYYSKCVPGKTNLAPFELTAWLLGKCRNLEEAKRELEKIHISDLAFSKAFPVSPLHWMIADKTGALTVESVREGLKVYENPVGVLTNNPPFPYHMTRLTDFMILSREEPENRFGHVPLAPYSRGMGAMGLPGDLSSSSRFVRAAFVKLNSVCADTEEESVGQFFHILGAVTQVQGCVRMPDGRYERTQYASCIHADKGVFYYTTYENPCISCVDMHMENLNGTRLSEFALSKKMILNKQN